MLFLSVFSRQFLEILLGLCSESSSCWVMMMCTAAAAAALTGAQGVAGALLHRHALAERPAVQRRRVGAGASPLLDAAAAAHVARRPVRPRRPATVHCRERREGGECETVGGGGIKSNHEGEAPRFRHQRCHRQSRYSRHVSL